MKKLLYLFIAISIVACGSGVKNIKIKNEFSMDIPSGMDSSSQLNDNAVMQYEKPIDELYVIVIKDTKEEYVNSLRTNMIIDTYDSTVNGFSKLMYEDFNRNYKIKGKPNFVEKSLNGSKAKLIDIDATTADKIDCHFKIAYIEGKKNMYQVLTWTLADKKDLNEEKMTKMIESFKEL